MRKIRKERRKNGTEAKDVTKVVQNLMNQEFVLDPTRGLTAGARNLHSFAYASRLKHILKNLF